MKLFIMLSLAAMAFAGCSKSNPQIELKERVVEQNVHTYDALTANEEFVTSDSKGLIEVINKIRIKRSVGFNWKSFWFNVSEKINPNSLSEEAASGLFSLAGSSCEENPESADLILGYAKNGLKTLVATNSNQASSWLGYFLDISSACKISNEPRFTVEYVSVFRLVSGIKEHKDLKVQLLEDLNLRIPKSSSKLLVDNLKGILYQDGDGVFLVDVDTLSFEEMILFAKTHESIFPYRENPFLSKLLAATATDLDSVEAALPADFSKALAVLDSLKIPDSNLTVLNDKLLQRWSAVRDADRLNSEERITSFSQSLYDAEIIFSLLEKELKKTNDLNKSLGKLEVLYRKLEASFMLVPRKDQTLLKYDRRPLVLLLDWRLALILKRCSKLSQL